MISLNTKTNIISKKIPFQKRVLEFKIHIEFTEANEIHEITIIKLNNDLSDNDLIVVQIILNSY